MSKRLRMRREILLIGLQAQRQIILELTPPKANDAAFYPRSATMQFILQRPRLWLWVVGEGLPYVLNRFMKRDHRRRECD